MAFPALPAIVGGGIGLGVDLYMNKRNQDRAENEANNNIAMQREFAQNGIRWKVEDAKAAGLHPLAALGTNTASFTPVSSVGDSSPVGHYAAQMGQDISRAMAAGMTKEELTHKRLQNSLLASQIEETDQRTQYMRAKQTQDLINGMQGPSKPIPSSSANEFGTIKFKADEQTSKDPKDRSATAGRHSMWRKYDFLPGVRIDLINSEDPAESMEGLGALALTAYRNGVYRPSKFFDRAMWKALNGYRSKTWQIGSEQLQRDHPDGLVSTPTR